MLVGDGIHNFCDGAIIAAAFLADTKLGFATAVAIVAHEIPQEVGDYIVLLNAGATLYAANVSPTLADGIERARAALDSGAARAKLDACVKQTQALGKS